jgi:hypothetical protein
MAAQYSFLSSCQQIAQEELGQLDLGPGPPAIQQSAQLEQKVKKREKLLSLIGGLIPATKNHGDIGDKEHGADHAHDKKGTRFKF